MTSSWIDYAGAEMAFRGYGITPETTTDPVPGVLVVPNLWGPNDYWVEMAHQYASLGYAVLVVDLYGVSNRPETYEAAKALVEALKVDPAIVRTRMQAAFGALTAVAGVDASRIAACGYCVGGMGALEFGRGGGALQAIVSFHGHLATPFPEDAKNIRCPLLVLHGAEDPGIPDAMVADFMAEMRAAACDWQLVHFGGQVHAFTDKIANRPGAMYNAQTDRRSWRMMVQFLEECFAAK